MHYHKSFSWATFKNDVCILELKDDVSDVINGLFPCLPPSDFDFDAGSVCYVAGWGLTQETASLSPVLKSLVILIIEKWLNFSSELMLKSLKTKDAKKCKLIQQKK